MVHDPSEAECLDGKVRGMGHRTLTAGDADQQVSDNPSYRMIGILGHGGRHKVVTDMREQRHLLLALTAQGIGISIEPVLV